MSRTASGAISSTFQTRGEPSPIRGIVVSADEPETVRARNGLCSLLDIELNEDMLDVRFDGLACDAKTSCDFLVGSALGDQIEDVALPDAEWV
jgi:hypothetical protein